MIEKTRRRLINDHDLKLRGRYGDRDALDLSVLRYQNTVYGQCVFITRDAICADSGGGY